MATAEELKAFLKKRGYDAEAEVVESGNYRISLYCKSAEDATLIFSEIREPGRFVISVKLADAFDLIEQGLRLGERLGEIIAEFDGKLVAHGIRINASTELGKAYAETVVGQVSKAVDSQLLRVSGSIATQGLNLEKEISALRKELKETKDNLALQVQEEAQKPWWKKPWRKPKCL